MVKEIVMFGDIKIKKHKLHRYKNPILLKYVDIDTISISKKIPAKKINK